MTGNVWFTSDLHIGHRMVAELRGHKETDTHDNTLAENWSKTVKQNDQIWVLGDISVGGSRAQEYALSWMRSLPGVKHLIAGNHDGVAPMHRNSHKWMDVYMSAFESVQSAARRKHNGQEILLSHYPYEGDHSEVQRYDQWRLPDYGLPILHGHTHSSEKVSYSPKCSLQIHVGVDAWGLRPVALKEIVELLEDYG